MKPGEPVFLSRAEVEHLHAESLRRFGGSTGVRDDGLVESALGSARNAWWYGGGDLCDVAAAYAFHIAQAQAYLDGNKRTAVAAALVFLRRNGLKTGTDDGRIYHAMIAIAERRMDKVRLAALLRELAGKTETA